MNLLELLQYQFFQNAISASIFASILCGIVGTYIVARRIVFISGGITHASFGGIGMAYYFGFNPLLGAAIFAVFSALGIEVMSKKIEIREDSAIGILWSLGMAVGIIFIFLSPGYAPNLMTSLFGSILNVGRVELILMAVLSVMLIIIFALLYRPILAVAFDEDYARSHRIPVSFINYLMIVLLSLVIVMNIRVVGIILVLSLLTIPQSAANIFTRHFGRLMMLSVLFSFVGCIAGLLISFYGNLPSGASIIFALVIIFVIAKLGHWIVKSVG